jgi:hypothetical protein
MRRSFNMSTNACAIFTALHECHSLFGKQVDSMAACAVLAKVDIGQVTKHAN